MVRYGRPVELTLDGESRRLWTTARTVDEALRELGVRAEGAHLSVSRSSAISREGLALDVRTERAVTFLADGRERTVRTNAATVAEALEQAGITLGAQDTTSVPPPPSPATARPSPSCASPAAARSARRPSRTRWSASRTPTCSRAPRSSTGPAARACAASPTSCAPSTASGQKPRRTHEETVREPVTQIVKVGTRPMPTSVEGADGLDWNALAQCESGGRPDAVDPSGTYGGLYQFDPGTWRALGGSGRAQDAPASEQTYRAKKLYVQRGASPWPHCGRRLYR
ncbi:hypothetical protein GCM10023237_40490 [Streptomyces coeruleoprunus]